ncbi:hypothetical protein [Desulfovulcanus sp.]
MIESYIKEYKNVAKTIRFYWRCYGGLNSIKKSPYLHCSIILSLLSLILGNNCDKCPSWYDYILNIIPNILGFTLGGYAVLLAFSDANFLEVLAGKENDKESPFLVLNGTFIHFIVVQSVSILWALLGSIWQEQTCIIAFCGYVLLFYALLTAIATGFAILNMAKWFDLFIEFKKKNNQNK